MKQDPGEAGIGQKSPSGIWTPPLLILGAALLATAPLALRGGSCGHDFDFHLLSWMEAARGWQAGLVDPHWVRDANFGAGEPRLVFYPPASWILGGLLGSATSWTAAPVLFVFLALLGCGWGMYRLARMWLSPGAAAIAACFYATNPYALFVVYERSAMGELLAAVWLPLIVLFALKRTSSIAALSCTVAAVWLSNLPAGLIVSYMLGTLALGAWLVKRKAWLVLRAAGGLALGFGLAAFYLLPAAYEQRWVQIGRAILPGLRAQDNFLFEHTGDALHDQVLHTASWILVGEMTMALVAAWLARGKPHGRRVRIGLTLLLPAILFLQLPVSAMIWTYAPKLNFLQFPWRWLMVVSLAASVLVGIACQSPRPPWVKLAAWATIAAIAVGGPLLFFQRCDEEDAPAAAAAAFRAGAGLPGTDEYTPTGADPSSIQQNLPQVRVLREPDDDSASDSRKDNPEWRPDLKDRVPAATRITSWNGERWAVRVRSRASGYAVLRLLDYPAWQVRVNGSLVRDRPHREDGLLTVPVDCGNTAIEVTWRTTPDQVAGRALTGAATLLLAGSVLQLRRRRLRQVS